MRLQLVYYFEQFFKNIYPSSLFLLLINYIALCILFFSVGYTVLDLFLSIELLLDPESIVSLVSNLFSSGTSKSMLFLVIHETLQVLSLLRYILDSKRTLRAIYIRMHMLLYKSLENLETYAFTIV